MAPDPSLLESVVLVPVVCGFLVDALCEIVAALSAFFAELCESGYNGGAAGVDTARFRLVDCEVAPVAAIKAFFLPSSALLQSA
jgi:hypothetical protein